VLTAKEKRFIKYWEEQRTGGRWSYFALYIPVGTFLCSVITAFLFSMLSVVGREYFVSVAVVSAVLSVTITILTWNNNEKKFKSIIRREVKEGQATDAQPSDEKVF
jgi:VIT1/CCC1 family predicted Fe2+/Mn2+ transporter